MDVLLHLYLAMSVSDTLKSRDNYSKYCPSQQRASLIYSTFSPIIQFFTSQQLQSFLSISAPKSSHFVPAVLRTFDFVGIAPEKDNFLFVQLLKPLNKCRFISAVISSIFIKIKRCFFL